MQVDPKLNPQKESYQNKEFYNSTVLKFNSLSELCHDISNTESLDINVEKFLCDIADNYVDSILDTACQLAKHKKSDYVTSADLSIAMGKKINNYLNNNFIS